MSTSVQEAHKKIPARRGFARIQNSNLLAATGSTSSQQAHTDKGQGNRLWHRTAAAKVQGVDRNLGTAVVEDDATHVVGRERGQAEKTDATGTEAVHQHVVQVVRFGVEGDTAPRD